MKIFYFTATGNNLYLAKNFNGELYSIPKVLKNGPYSFKDDKIGLIFPCYFAMTPRIVKEFLEKIQLNSKYIFAIISYGNMAGGSIDDIQKAAQENGIKLSYANKICMVDNYIPMFDMNKELIKKDDDKIDEKMYKIVEDIKNSKLYLPKTNIFMKVISSISEKMYIKNQGTFDKHFQVTNDCDGCKTCEKVCPVDNITVNKRPEYKNNCDICLACTHLCPQNAIRLTNEKSIARFRNKNVRVSEIINANN